MDQERFDRLTRTLASGISRRTVLGGITAGVAAGLERLTGIAQKGNGGGGGGAKGRCPEGTVNCRGKCVILAADENNCGACAVVCPAGWDCCNGSCTDPDVFLGDENNCGACGKACPAGYLCCGGACVPSNSDNCGTCGTTCRSDEACCDGTCVCGGCAGEVCAGDLICRFDICGCPGPLTRCAGDLCQSCGPNMDVDPDDCSCICPITAANCDPSIQVFDEANCECDCISETTFGCGPLCCDRETESCSFDGSAYSCNAL